MSLELQELVGALRDQALAINQLVKSNQQVIALLTDVVASLQPEPMDDDGGDQTLDD